MRRLSELIENLFNFWGNFGWSPWRKIREATEGRGSVLKLKNVVWEELVKIPWDSPSVTVIRKLMNTFRSIDGAYLCRFCHKTAKIHSLCIILSKSQECKKMIYCYTYQNRYQTQTERIDIRSILRSLSQFYIIQIGRWLKKVLHVVKARTIRKRELSIVVICPSVSARTSISGSV